MTKRMRKRPSLLKRRYKKFFWYGDEKLTWMAPGAVVGFAVGLITGLVLLSFAWRTGSSGILASLSSQYPNLFEGYLLFTFLTFMSGCIGAIAGAFVGIGVPRYNPKPEQGHWESRGNNVHTFEVKNRKIKITKPRDFQHQPPQDIDAERHPEEQLY